MTLSIHGTSDYTGTRTSHVLRLGIETRLTAWKSRALTTQPVTHTLIFTWKFQADKQQVNLAQQEQPHQQQKSQPFQRLRKEDVDCLLNQVKLKFRNQPQFDEFLDIMLEYKSHM